MKISTKGRYALRLMMDLAKKSDENQYISIRTISENQGLSEKYLEQIIILLNKAGYVKSLRGKQGGYRLSWKVEEYTVGMILRLTEGNLAPVACLIDEVNQCERAEFCQMLIIWMGLHDKINAFVDGISLRDLIDGKFPQIENGKI